MPIEEEYTEYLKGKRVCLVGPAGHIMKIDQKDLIESYDIVARLNKAWPVPEGLQQCSGVRTDILYSAMATHCLPEKNMLWTKEFKKEVKFLVCPFERQPPCPVVMGKVKSHKIPFIQFDPERYSIVMKDLKTNPNSGTGAIIHLLLYPIKELYVTGIAFLQGGYTTGYRNYAPNKGAHTPSKQIEYIRGFIWPDPRITADEVFTNIMEK